MWIKVNPRQSQCTAPFTLFVKLLQTQMSKKKHFLRRNFLPEVYILSSTKLCNSCYISQCLRSESSWITNFKNWLSLWRSNNFTYSKNLRKKATTLSRLIYKKLDLNYYDKKYIEYANLKMTIAHYHSHVVDYVSNRDY